MKTICPICGKGILIANAKTGKYYRNKNRLTGKTQRTIFRQKQGTETKTFERYRASYFTGEVFCSVESVVQGQGWFDYCGK